jgi:hypothetical protein
VQATLLDIHGVAVIFPHFFLGQETTLDGAFFPLAGPAEMPLLLSAVEAVTRSGACPHFSWVRLGRSPRAMAAVQPTARGFKAATFSILVLGGRVGLQKNVAVSLPIPSILDQIFADRALVAANPVALRDRKCVEGVLDNPPWGGVQVVLTFEGEEPDAYLLVEGLSNKTFRGPAGSVVLLDFGFAYQDQSGARNRMQRWWQSWKTQYPGAAAAYAPVTFARMPRYDMAGVRQRLTNELARDGKIDGRSGATIRARTPSVTGLPFGPATPASGSSSSGNQRPDSKRRRRPPSRSGSSGSDSDPCGVRRNLSGSRYRGGPRGGAGQGGEGPDELVLTMLQSSDGVLIPGAMPVLRARGQNQSALVRGVQGCMQFMWDNTQAAQKASQEALTAATQGLTLGFATKLKETEDRAKVAAATAEARAQVAAAELKEELLKAFEKHAKEAKEEVAALNTAFRIDLASGEEHTKRLAGLRENEVQAIQTRAAAEEQAFQVRAAQSRAAEDARLAAAAVADEARIAAAAAADAARLAEISRRRGDEFAEEERLAAETKARSAAAAEVLASRTARLQAKEDRERAEDEEAEAAAATHRRALADLRTRALEKARREAGEDESGTKATPRKRRLRAGAKDRSQSEDGSQTEDDAQLSARKKRTPAKPGKGRSSGTAATRASGAEDGSLTDSPAKTRSPTKPAKGRAPATRVSARGAVALVGPFAAAARGAGVARSNSAATEGAVGAGGDAQESEAAVTAPP